MASKGGHGTKNDLFLGWDCIPGIEGDYYLGVFESLLLEILHHPKFSYPDF